MTRDPDPRDPIPWGRILRELGRRYGWAPDAIWGLTLPEVRLFLADDAKQPGHREGITLSDAMTRLNASRAARGLPPLTEVRPLTGGDGRTPQVRAK